MPVQQGIVGPIPQGADAEAYDKLRRRVLWTMPSGLYVIGSRHGDRLNLMTANWVTQVSFDPKLVGVSVEREAATTPSTTRAKRFWSTLLAAEDRPTARKSPKPAGWTLAGTTWTALR